MGILRTVSTRLSQNTPLYMNYNTWQTSHSDCFWNTLGIKSSKWLLFKKTKRFWHDFNRKCIISLTVLLISSSSIKCLEGISQNNREIVLNDCKQMHRSASGSELDQSFPSTKLTNLSWLFHHFLATVCGFLYYDFIAEWNRYFSVSAWLTLTRDYLIH